MSSEPNAEGFFAESGSDEEWFQDVARDLDTYSRLSMAGHYREASWYFDDLLNTSDAEFPVVAQHADTLIDQVVFGQAEEFLRTRIGPELDVRTGDDKHLILLLMLIQARIYTQCDTTTPRRIVSRALQELGTVYIEEEMSPEKVLYSESVSDFC